MFERLMAVGAAVALVLTACSSDDAGPSAADTERAASPGSPPAADGDVYLPPDPLPPGEPGELIWAEEVDAPAGARAWRVLHHSESLAGDDIAVSGVVVAPESDPPPGGRPVVTWAHGTRGLADPCAPSKREDLLDVVPALDDLLAAGYVVVATDYEGLGTPGLHPFLVGESEGRGVLDIARAASQVDDAGASDRVGVFGHSQGGHAALFAGQIAPEYAPDVDVVGVAAGAPVGDLPLLLGVASEVPEFVGFIVMGGLGFAAAYPEADPATVLTEEALDDAAVVEELCADEILEEFEQPVEQVVARSPLDVPPWPELLEVNTPGAVATEAPVFVFQGSEDALVPPFVTREWFERVCALGTSVELVEYEGADHGGVVDVARDDILGWLGARFDGAEATSTCA